MPPNLSVWVYSARISFIRSVSLLFDWKHLVALVGNRAVLPESPYLRLCVRDQQLFRLARLLADTVEHAQAEDAGEGLDDLFAASLAQSVMVGWARFDRSIEAARPGRGLSKRQLRAVIELLEGDLRQRVDLAHLAATAGLSQSQFYKAFKRSTGMPPYRWLLDARIRRAQELL